ncbi:uncharacterized protein LOC125491946 [Beta vulgaris subsp. vulgaris]|uniref:uncharacterized protein LOC125491946 n=1 Tax=Beta vulgaris subsp. vulgaris TaxID=3555 RepID=UPI00254789CE|nr:uncharacterized protein LOC125491946 [Beta vulgaris subsp. vulgaris]
MPYPNDLIIEDGQNKMIMDELSYDRGKLKEEFQRLFQGLTTEQRGIYNEIMSAVSRGKGGVFFVYGYGGTALDRSLKDVMQFVNPANQDITFGGKVVVFAGDLRKILPVVPKGSRQDIVFSAINSSYLWDFCRVLRLTKNMRLTTGSNGGHDPIATIVESTYPDIADHIWEPSYFQERAILAPTNEIAETVNDHVLSQLPGEERTYLSSDAISVEEGNFGIHEMYSTEFLNTIKCGGLPNHSI